MTFVKHILCWKIFILKHMMKHIHKFAMWLRLGQLERAFRETDVAVFEQGGQTILKNSNRPGVFCTVIASFISQPHKSWFLLTHSCIIHRKMGRGKGRPRKLILVSMDCLITFVPFQKL